MKLRDIVRKDPKQMKTTLKAEKRRKKDVPDEWLNVKADGEGDNAIRGFNDADDII